MILAPLRAQQTAGPASLPSPELIPDRELIQLDRAELGKRFVEADTRKYLAAHEQLEIYFANSADRAETIKRLSTLGLDANNIGRLARIRSDWPEIQSGAYYINEGQGPTAVHYFLGVPAGYRRAKRWPLVIKLPTADVFAHFPDAVEVTRIYGEWINDELKRHPDAVVIMPLLNLNELWGPSYPGMASVMQPMQHVGNLINLDPQRVYLMGHSMAGHAAWNLALLNPTYFASFCALAGTANEDWQRVRIMNLRNTFPVFWHDTNDQVIPIESAQPLVRLLTHFQVPFDFKQTKDIGHVPTEPIVDERYALMRSKVRDLNPLRVSIRSTRPDTLFNRVDWLQIFQASNPGPQTKWTFMHGTGRMIAFNAPATLEGSISQNAVSINATNVDLLRVYLNDELVDLSKPVKIILNHKTVQEGMLQPNVETALKDQLLIGRGWRTYTVAVDLSTSAPTTRPK